MKNLFENNATATKAQKAQYVLALCETVVKVSDDAYVDKATLAQFLFDNDIICRALSNNEIKKTKREELINMLRTAVESLKPTKEEVKDFYVGQSKGIEISKRIVLGGIDRNGKKHGKAMFIATTSKDPEVNGKLILTMNKLFAIVGDVYDTHDEEMIKNVINYLCKQKYLRFKKYESGAITFFPTKKMVSAVTGVTQ